MNVVIHCKKLPWHKRYFEYFKRGFQRHGINVFRTEQTSPHSQADIAVLFGPNYWKAVERSHSNFLMVNRKFIGNVDDNVTISWDGYNGHGRFCVQEVNPLRLRRHSFDIRPWQDPVLGHVLLLGQFDLGRCGRYATLQEWYDHVKANTGDKILFRGWPGNSPIRRDAYGAKQAVSLNSTAAIETVLLGCPTVVMDEQSPCWNLCNHHMGDEHRPENRIGWLEYLANCQWHYLQIKNGDFWRQLWPKHGERLCDVRL